MGILTTFLHADLPGKCITFLLVGFSFLAWTILLGKYFELRTWRSGNQLVHFFLSRNSIFSWKEWKIDAQLPFLILVKNATKVFESIKTETIPAHLRSARLENAIQRTVAAQILRYQSKMIILGSIVSGAPFLGLLGTVWGVMNTFGNLSQSSCTSLQAIAPGVSSALLTTVAGLFVAIPSVFGYNFLLTYAKVMTTELENFASSLVDEMDAWIASEFA